MAENGIAQLVGELIACHYHHHFVAGAQAAGAPPPRIFALRLCGVRAALFSLEATREQIDTICNRPESQWPSAGKMKLVSSVADPTSAAEGSCGANLLHKEERREFIELMAKLRKHLVQRR